jgi:type IV secretory pathway TraG/TraD family ATPase VirD4
MPRPSRDPLQTVRGAALWHGRGAYLGLTSLGQLRFARAQRAVLLLGPPRSGKTSGVIVPALLSHPGPPVSSTKPDVWRATNVRKRGRATRPEEICWWLLRGV